MPTFQEIYNKHSAAISQGLISPDEPLSTFAQRGFQVTGDPSYKNVADSGWFSNAVRARSADLSNFVESGPVDEWTSEAVGRIGDLFGSLCCLPRANDGRVRLRSVDHSTIPVLGGESSSVGDGACRDAGCSPCILSHRREPACRLQTPQPICACHPLPARRPLSLM